jgi:hypothetical protein
MINFSRKVLNKKNKKIGPRVQPCGTLDNTEKEE